MHDAVWTPASAAAAAGHLGGMTMGVAAAAGQLPAWTSQPQGRQLQAASEAAWGPAVTNLPILGKAPALIQVLAAAGCVKQLIVHD